MATRRKQPEPAPIEIKQFTLEEVDQGIIKLRRRIEEVKALETDQVQPDDQRVYNAQENISVTMLEVFGPNSPEYRAHRYHRIWRGTEYAGMEEYELQQGFSAGIPRTVTMLDGLISRLEEKRADLGKDTTARVRTAFEGLELHSRIASACADLYRDGHYRNAVLDAAIALVNFVKEKSRRHDLDGSDLMLKVFSPNNPVLVFNDLADQGEKDEQQGMMFLFAGAVAALRNPRAHTLLGDAAEEALEYIALLSFLAKKLDTAKRPKVP